MGWVVALFAVTRERRELISVWASMMQLDFGTERGLGLKEVSSGFLKRWVMLKLSRRGWPGRRGNTGAAGNERQLDAGLISWSWWEEVP